MRVHMRVEKFESQTAANNIRLGYLEYTIDSQVATIFKGTSKYIYTVAI